MTSISLLPLVAFILAFISVGSIPIQAQIPIQTASGYLCFIFYSNPGDVEYPWSSATSVQFTYSTTTITNANGTAVTILSGAGQRIYTNMYGTSALTTPFTVTAPAITSGLAPDNLLYLGSAFPVDALGLTWNLSSPIQLPGDGPNAPVSLLKIYKSPFGVVVEGNEERVDSTGTVFLSTVPGFTNVTIGPTDINNLAVLYAACKAPITFTNYLRPPSQTSASNSAQVTSYSYFISDGATYSVTTNLTLTANMGFSTSQDELGNVYQTIIDITGTRIYNFLASTGTGPCQVNSVVSGLSTVVDSTASQRWYPFALLGAPPGFYTTNTAPYLDGEGLEFAVSPSVPANGDPAGCSGGTYAAVNVLMQATVNNAVLTEGGLLPLSSLQQQAVNLLATCPSGTWFSAGSTSCQTCPPGQLSNEDQSGCIGQSSMQLHIDFSTRNLGI